MSAVALSSVAVVCIGFSGGAAASTVRHYEQVSPADKGLGDIVGDGITTVASASGEAVAFSSRAQFAGAVGSGVSGQTQYAARRSPAGAWSTQAITPMPRTDAVQTFFGATKLQIFSTDLKTALLWGYDLPAASGDEPERNSMYLEDTETRALEPITVSQQDPLSPFDFLSEQVYGVSDDARHVAFASFTRLLPEAVSGAQNLYRWDNGTLSMAGVLPDGTVPPGGATVYPDNYRGAMSADGSRLAFSSPPFDPSAQLYLRIGGRTVWISEKETRAWRDRADTALPTNVVLEGMSRDGRTVFFVTDDPLSASDGNSGPDLYRYTDSADPARDDNLAMISSDGDAAHSTQFGGSLVGFSEDNERVYFHTLSGKLEVWDHGNVQVINSQLGRDASSRLQITLTASQPGGGRVTPDGRYVAFLSNAAFDNVHGPTGDVTNGHYEMYFYNSDDGTLRCVSCPSSGATSDVTVTPNVTAGNPTIANLSSRPHFLSDNGQVFFSTAEALVPQDANGVADTYEYDGATAELTLLTPGKGRDPTMFADASASGNDVFVLTRQALGSSDHDDLVDLYDVRAGAALPTEEINDPVPCEGEGCQPPPSSAPADDTVGSPLFEDSASGSSQAKKALVARSSATLRGASGALGVRITAPGKLQWSGKGLRSGSVKRSRAGKVRLSLHLTRRARTQLSTAGRYVTSLKLTLKATGGTQGRASVRLTFRLARKGA